MSILKEICEYKKHFVKNQKKIKSNVEIIEECSKLTSVIAHTFQDKLIKGKDRKISIIGELKRSSPSAGRIIEKEINLVDMAKTYQKNGICCLSVLTDEKYFNGSNKDLIEIRNNVDIPILRKDFIIDEYQIYESKIIGADCILLILSALDNEQALLFENIALNIGLDVLIETHDESEIERALLMNSKLIGINNRNLNNFTVNIENSINLSKGISSEKVLVAESGISNRSDIDSIMLNSTIETFLIGESLMRSSDLGSDIKNLIN